MAIAFDAYSFDEAGGITSLTTAHTTSGSDRVLAVGVMSDTTSDLITGITYDGTSLTKVGTVTPSGGTRYNYLFVSASEPTSGSNNVVTSASSSTFILHHIGSYTGANTTGQPDSSNEETQTTSTNRTMTTSVVAANCWLVGHLQAEQTTSAGSGTVKRSSHATTFFGDSNGTVGTGSQSLVVNFSSSKNLGVIMSIAEAVAVAEVTPTPQLTTLQVG